MGIIKDNNLILINKLMTMYEAQQKQIDNLQIQISDKFKERISEFDDKFTEINSKIKSLHELIFKTKALCDIQQEQIEELQTEIVMFRNALSDVTLIVAHLSKKDETKG